MLEALRRPRVLIGALIVCGLVVVALWPVTVPVTTGRVVRGPLTVTIDEDGRTRVRDRFVVTAPVAGELMRIALRPGDRVERGRTVLATIRPARPVPIDARTRAELEAALRSAEAAVGRATAEEQRARTAADLAARQVRRSEALAEAGAMAREALEVQQAELRVLEGAVQAAEYAVAQARQEAQAVRARLGPTEPSTEVPTVTVTAPVDGVVLALHGESQRVVAPGGPLVDLGDPDAIEVVADLLSVDAVRVQAGSRVIVDRWGGPDPLEGRVRLVEPSGFTKFSALGVEEQRVNVIIDITDPPGAFAALGDGFRVEVRIVEWHDESTLQAPLSALFREGEGWAVYEVVDGRAVRRPVTVGRRATRDVQILDGVGEGATIVTYPPDTLEDGVRVAER